MLRNKLLLAFFPLVAVGCYPPSQIATDKEETVLQSKNMDFRKKGDKDIINILRFEVDENSTFNTARYWGTLQLENNCLVIDSGIDGTRALALPIDRNGSKEDVFWNSETKELHFYANTFKLGQNLDLGGGPIEPSYILGGVSDCARYNILAIHSIALVK